MLAFDCMMRLISASVVMAYLRECVRVDNKRSRSAYRFPLMPEIKTSTLGLRVDIKKAAAIATAGICVQTIVHDYILHRFAFGASEHAI